ncbi:MAG: hypothetical protein ABIB71_00135, partial [Candidatus Woesearchaeota archaeon]
SPKTEDGTLSFYKAMDLVNNAEKALYSSALSAIEPKKHYVNLHNKDVQGFIENCKFGQTEKGSFVATIICPLAKEAQLTLLPSFKPKDTITRKTIINLMKQLNFIATSIENKEFEGLINPKEGSPLLNSNFCEALLYIMEDKEDHLNVRITVSLAEGFNEEETIPLNVSIKKDYYPIIEETYKKLQPEEKPLESEFIGKVRNLNGFPNEEGEMQGPVVLTLQIEDERIIRVKVTLGVEDYYRAVTAHKQNKYIAIAGKIDWGIRLHNMENHTKFNIINSS